MTELKPNVLFLCTGNSARSQMAEGLLRQMAGDRFGAVSAGTEPKTLHPMATEVMREIGIDISAQRSKDVSEFLASPIQCVVTVCDHAKQRCPVFPNASRYLHWSVEDPAVAHGSDQEKLAVFRRIRDELRDRIRQEFAGPQGKEAGTTP